MHIKPNYSSIYSLGLPCIPIQIPHNIQEHHRAAVQLLPRHTFQVCYSLVKKKETE
jgi:hypothetical protein